MTRTKPSPILKSVAIHQLQALAVELKRTPTTKDIDAAARQKKCPSVETIRRMFGSFRDALIAAKLPLNIMQNFSELELIAQLQDLSSALRRPLTQRDVTKAANQGTCARPATFVRVFGNASNAFQKAGVQRSRRYSKNELITQYRSLSKEVGRPARISDIQRAARKGKCAGYHIYQSVCGGLTETRRVAGLLRGASKRYTRQHLIDQLKRFARKLGRTPTTADIRAAALRRETASLKTFWVYFGSHNRALREAGLEINKPSGFSRGHLISELQQLAKRLGKRPSTSDVDRASQAGLCPCSATYMHYFGSFAKALKAARLERIPGTTPDAWRNGQPLKYSQAEITKQLRQLSEKLGRTPTFSDVAAASKRGECPNTTTISRHFGRLSVALETAGFDPGERKQRTRERLIKQLQQLTRDLRRIPTSQDIIAARGRCSTPMTFVRHFGSMVNARKAALVADILKDVGVVGKAPRVSEKFERDALIDYLRTLAERLGRPPSTDDVREACRKNGGPGAKAFLREFGGIPAARKAARVEHFLRQIERAQPR